MEESQFYCGAITTTSRMNHYLQDHPITSTAPQKGKATPYFWPTGPTLNFGFYCPTWEPRQNQLDIRKPVCESQNR